MSRRRNAAIGFVTSLALSGVVWILFGWPFLFLAVPFVPFILPRRTDDPPARRCPTCGFRTRRGDHEYCPRDGSRLEQPGG